MTENGVLAKRMGEISAMISKTLFYMFFPFFFRKPFLLMAVSAALRPVNHGNKLMSNIFFQLQGDRGDKGDRGLTTTFKGDLPTGIIEGPPGPPGPAGKLNCIMSKHFSLIVRFIVIASHFN